MSSVHRHRFRMVGFGLQVTCLLGFSGDLLKSPFNSGLGVTKKKYFFANVFSTSDNVTKSGYQYDKSTLKIYLQINFIKIINFLLDNFKLHK